MAENVGMAGIKNTECATMTDGCGNTVFGRVWAGARVWLAMWVTVISACALPAKPVVVPDETEAFVITCDGPSKTWSTCYRAAASACLGARYSATNRTEEARPSVDGTTVKRSFMVKCY